MKFRYKPGDGKEHKFVVKAEFFPQFDGSKPALHEVCSTYDLAREIEWSTRQFVEDMLEESEEGVGTKLHIDHKSPAFVENEITITVVVETFERNELLCSFKALAGDRVVAEGVTGQKVFKREDLEMIMSKYKKG